ncbi:metal-dependent hydrolase [Acinetobacter sp. Marseille-Q1618]|uniref:metal-dependent hydrolase n=1 Tax=Acinetobacter sp. Marseille-Q1618 TaxID=2697502 RepID=UPI00156DC808|nr:metal-dependent hydrolase [Acinetobacter sp. Marseille-Q1618]
MNSLVKFQVIPVVRPHLEFKLHELPRFWFGGDAFKTRMFDALSITFPEGERYFIESVRQFRDTIHEPDLQQKVANFIRQEAQHGIAHDKMNQVMKQQGMPVDEFTGFLKKYTKFFIKYLSPEFNIAITAAAEHITALIAATFYTHQSTLADVHPYIRALFAWHAIEEMEHRDVAYDVMQNSGKISLSLRRIALVLVTFNISGLTLFSTNLMLKHDGFSLIQRLNMFATGLPWFIGANGTLSKMREHYLDWFKHDFHPSQHPIIRQYQTWLDVLQQTQDPIAAGNAFWQAAYPNE